MADAKLARRAKPYFLLQLCGYSEQVARLQGREPEQMHVVLGTRERQSFRYRRLRRLLPRRPPRASLAGVRSQAEPPYPLPVEHCAVCRVAAALRGAPRGRRSPLPRRQDPALRRRRPRLERAGIAHAGRAGRPPPEDTPRAAHGGRHLRDPAQPGARSRLEQTTHRPAALRAAAAGGRARLRPAAEPSPGDVFFDMEGDPFVEGGLEYLFGAVAADGGGEPRYRAWWAHDRPARTPRLRAGSWTS